jgi:Kef-type K+ transport system membrane component KefB
VPFALGYVAAVFLYPLLSNESVNVFNFAFFIGTALSVTAFPVLARILVERGLLQTRIGMISIASAAVVDVVAWCMLAFVILLARGNGAAINLIFTLLGSAVFVCTMFFVVRPLLRKFEKLHGAKQSITQGMLAFVIMLIFSSALITEWLGLHALFGAFLAGVIMPKDEDFIDELSGKLQDITIVLLLPIFFAFTGLKTTIGLLTGANVWGYCLLIIAIAIVGKIGGATFAARFTGLTWREAGAIGILLNTRGLVELIILNIGLEAGILSPTVFAMMVMMALVTTAITTPLLQLVFPTPKASEGEAS